MIIPRHLTAELKSLIQYYPIVSLTGPRQAGKTTLLQFLFPEYQYISLENPDNRRFAIDDPVGFLNTYHQKAIFDEAQRVPVLFSYLQTLVDKQKVDGQFILSGSQNFLLRKGITQSLAGRVGILRLMPFSEKELQDKEIIRNDSQESIYQGYYPGLYHKKLPPHIFYPNYLETYLHRDVQELINPKNLSTFERFMQLCAGHTGQQIVYSELANSIGVSTDTVKSWLSILEQSYIIFQLSPFYRNFNKRLVKSTKLYFYDTGLLCNLLEMQSANDVQNYYQRGALFENLVIADLFKTMHHQGRRPKFYYWRDNHQNEADLLWEVSNQIHVLEIKATQTLKSNHFKTLPKFKQWIPNPNIHLHMVYGGTENYVRQGVNVWSWQNMAEVLSTSGY